MIEATPPVTDPAITPALGFEAVPGAWVESDTEVDVTVDVDAAEEVEDVEGGRTTSTLLTLTPET